jgi:ParB-like chromosome segregation protein Spo0J
MQPLRMKEMRLAELRPAGDSSRTISDRAAAGLNASIRRFGLVAPLVYNERTGSLVAGRQRLAALLAAGEETTQVVVVDLAPEEERALSLALNNRHSAGRFAARAAGNFAGRSRSD